MGRFLYYIYHAVYAHSTYACSYIDIFLIRGTEVAFLYRANTGYETALPAGSSKVIQTPRFRVIAPFQSFSMDTLALECWVYGDDSYTTFPVKIPRTETVGSLNKVIKDENSVTFNSVDARHLVLYSIPTGAR